MDQAFVNGSPETLGKTAAQPSWVPELDAWETESEYIVQLDLPGVKAEAVDIGFEKNTLSIRGERERGTAPPKRRASRLFAERLGNVYAFAPLSAACGRRQHLRDVRGP
ncbi:MAG: Hsp20/alpha crystallin family protein [Gemmatimonadetes bacterium]|nr:Hsp20/alpha crystallin family protein [Gemmatimonadota bacterium]